MNMGCSFSGTGILVDRIESNTSVTRATSRALSLHFFFYWTRVAERAANSRTVNNARGRDGTRGGEGGDLNKISSTILH